MGVSQSSLRLMPTNKRPQSRAAAKTTLSAAEPVTFKGKGRENLLHQQVTAVGSEQRTKFYQLLN